MLGLLEYGTPVYMGCESEAYIRRMGRGRVHVRRCRTYGASLPCRC